MQHKKKLSVTALVLALLAFSLPAKPRAADAGAAEATIRNFVSPSLLKDDGLPPHPAAPLKYGAPAWHVDADGDGIEEHDATIAWFAGRYYLYAEKWGCGKLVFFAGRIPGRGPARKYPPQADGGACGFGVWSSTDLTHWKPEGRFEPKGVKGTPSKPHVLWSAPLRKYVLWFKAGSNFARTGGLYYATSDTPVGPWSRAEVATGDHLGHDFDIALAPDGTAYIATDSFSGSYDRNSPGGSKPLWDLWVQRLNAAMTGTLGTPESRVRVLHAVDFEALGFFEHGGGWYITGGPTCGNCQVPISYIRASSPLGPWRNEEGDTGSALTAGTTLTADGCTGQNKGADMLPSAAGPIVLAGVWGYRTSPTDYAPNDRVAHGDNSQAISSTYWFPLSFDKDGRIAPLTCPATVKVPLAKTVTAPVPAPAARQPDCRIRPGSAIEQRWSGRSITGSILRVPVFQRTDNEGPFGQAGAVLNAPLRLEAQFADGSTVAVEIPPGDISWAPQIVSLPLKAAGMVLTRLTLSTKATNGCYGTLVEPKSGGASYGLRRGGAAIPSPAAQLYILP